MRHRAICNNKTFSKGGLCPPLHLAALIITAEEEIIFVAQVATMVEDFQEVVVVPEALQVAVAADPGEGINQKK